MDGVFGNFRLYIGYVFYVAYAGLSARLERATAVRAVLGSMFHLPVYPLGMLASPTKMAFFRSRLLFATGFSGWFFICWHHPRWGAGMSREILSLLRLG